MLKERTVESETVDGKRVKALETGLFPGKAIGRRPEMLQREKWEKFRSSGAKVWDQVSRLPLTKVWDGQRNINHTTNNPLINFGLSERAQSRSPCQLTN